VRAGGKDIWVIAAAVGQQIRDRLAYPGCIHRVDHIACYAARLDQPGLLKRRKVKRQPRRSKTQGLRDLPGWHTHGTLRHQKPDQVKPGLVRQGRECCEDFVAIHFTSIHRSTIQERLK
jgi:hypothetical protein